MKLNIINVEQGTPEWKQARAGRVTASRIKDVLAKGKGSAESASRADFRMEIVCSMLTGEPQEDGFFSKDMAWGVDHESEAREAYSVENGVLVDQVGMVVHIGDDRCAASPDGMVGWDGENEPEGLVEIKCPKTKTHIGYLMAGGVPTEYQPQMLWQMACTGAQWCDFVSYDPRLSEALQLYICRFPRDEARIEEIQNEVSRFLDECEKLHDTLAKMGEAA